MSYVRLWIHAVWGTKSHRPVLTREIREQVIHHIRENARTKEICIDRLNGYTEHLHCLFALNADMSVAKALQLMKGESAFWTNKERVTPTKFEWADEYYAVSVSESALPVLRAYIERQEQHHRKSTYSEEVATFLMDHNFVNQG